MDEVNPALICDGCDTKHPEGTSCVIPKATCYVTFSDDEHKELRFVVPCESREQAEEVRTSLRADPELKGMRFWINMKPPGKYIAGSFHETPLRRIFAVFKPEHLL